MAREYRMTAYCKCRNKLNSRNKSGICQQCRKQHAKKIMKENLYYQDITKNRELNFQATPQKIATWLHKQ
jgi:hypothetical protein